MVTQENNDRINSKPTTNELQEVVFSMYPNSTAGIAGFNWYFFQKNLHIINQHLMEVVLSFFSGHDIPKYFYHSCIVLLPKMNNPKKLKEFRLISVTNFSSKIISKLLSATLRPIFPSLVSLN